MAVYLIAYEINTVGAETDKILQGIKNIGIGWMHYLPNVVLLHSNDNAEVIGKKIFKLITKTDQVLVIRVTKEYYGWLPKRAWDWLNSEVRYD
jgi:hypothetical protein